MRNFNGLSGNKFFLYPFIVLVFCFLTFLFAYQNKETKLYSRKIMELSEALVMNDMSASPPEVARIYAEVSSIYFETLKNTKNSEYATLASLKYLKDKYPEKTNEPKFQRFLTSLNIPESISLPVEIENQVKNSINEDKKYLDLSKIKLSTSQDSWKGESPFGLDAILYSNFIVDKDYLALIQQPPKNKSPEMQKSIDDLVFITSKRSLEQGALINFWSGMHMSPGVAGIWQNRMYDVVKSYQLKDEDYAYAQMVLAHSLADTLTEVWKIKYKYLTKRPSNFSDKINLDMADPNYPSYVSEFSSTAVTAREILTVMFPKGKNIFLNDSQNASKVGVWAGCSFDFDEKGGADLGKLISQDIITKINLTTVSNGTFLPFEIFTPKVGVYQRSY